MKQNRFFMIFAGVLLLAMLACNFGATPTALPTGETIPATQEQESSGDEVVPESESGPLNDEFFSGGDQSGGLVTFTDEDTLFAIDLPSDWNYGNTFLEDDGVYIDRFESPDQVAIVENIKGFSETPLTGKSNGKIALYFLHKYYSNTGEQGDIRISSDNIQPDGSERLVWTSKGGGYSGLSFFEVRGSDRTTFLMLTAWWGDDADQATIDTVQAIIESYRIP